MLKLQRSEIQSLSEIIAAQADNAPLQIGAKGYLINLIRQTNWPPDWQRQRANALTGVPDFDAQALVQWAQNQGTNPADHRYTVIGGLIEVLLTKVGLEEARWLAVLVVSHQLYHEEALRANLIMRYQIPQAAVGAPAEISDFGPEIHWRGPTEAKELHGWLKPEPDLLDVGFLLRATARAASVCRIELPNVRRQGTGFLIAPDKLLTNYHVLKYDASDNLEENAHQVILRFGDISAVEEGEAAGQTFKLDKQQPVLKFSSDDKLDYALLRVEEQIQGAQGLEPAPYTLALPRPGMGLHILQHPAGQALQLALSGDGVDAVWAEGGIVQYSTRASVGSSGAPCFTDDWKVIAMHHAQTTKRFGTVTIREGILLQSIFQEIEPLLR